MKYIQLDEAAILEGIPYHTLVSRIRRNPEKYETMKEQNYNGGKEKVLISFSSLSATAKKKYKVKESKSKVSKDDAPWYTYVPFEWYKKKYEKYFFEAVEMARDIERYLSGELEMNPSEFEEFMSKKLGVSTRTIRRAVKDYMEAAVWAEDSELETGENYDYYKVLAVARKPKDDMTFPSLTEEMQAYIENTWYDEKFALNQNPVTNLYEDFCELAEMKKWTKVPSYDTVNRYINYLMEQDGKGARDLASKGLRYWKNRNMMKRYRDLEKLDVLEIVVGDAHTFDCWVSVKRANGKMQAIKPCLLAWIDMRSRTLVGWVICECPDQDIMKQSVINMIYPKKNPNLPYGVPKYLLIDNGKEYTAESLTGRPRNVRVTFDEDIKGFYRSIGVQDDIRSLPYQPWSKAQVERFFGTVCTKFSKRIASYTGTLTGSRTEAKINKDIKKMLDNGELITLEEFSARWEEWVVSKYHCRKHRGLMAQGEEIPAPISVFNTADKYIKAAPPFDYTCSLLMRGETRKVTNMGIVRTIDGKQIQYTHQELSRYIGQRVEFKYYPEDITKVRVYTLEGKFICEAMSYELLHIAPKVSEAAMVEHIKDQKRQQKRDREIIAKRRMTYEERQELDLNEAGKKVVGPEIKPNDNKVVAHVNDNRYIEDKKAERESVKESQITHSQIKASTQTSSNKYLQKKAEEAFAKLQQLG